MEPITGLLRMSGGSIVLLFCLYSALTLYWYLTEDDATTYQCPVGTADTSRTEDSSTAAQHSLGPTDTSPTEDSSTPSQRTPWAADTSRTEDDPPSTERHRRRQRRR